MYPSMSTSIRVNVSLSPGQDPKNSGGRVHYICENILPNLATCFPACHGGFKLSFVGLSEVSLVCLPLAVNHSGGNTLIFHPASRILGLPFSG